MKTISLLLLIAMAPGLRCFGDMGSLPFTSGVRIVEPRQDAIIAWNGKEQLLYLQTTLGASSETKVLEVMPLPSKPEVEAGHAGVFERWMTYDPKKVYATVVGTYRTKANAVRPEDLSAFDKSIADIYDLTSFELWEVNEAEEAAAATTSSQENFGGSDDEDLALALGIGIGALIIGVFAFGSGCLLVFLIMRSRKPPTPLPPFPANRPGPPPLPPGSGAP